MNQQDTAETSAIEEFPVDTDIVDQDEDDDPDERAGDEVAYDLDAPSDQAGGA